MRKGVKTYTLPGQEYELEELINEPLVEVTHKVITPCPKEGIILVYIEYDDYREKGAL